MVKTSKFQNTLDSRSFGTKIIPFAVSSGVLIIGQQLPFAMKISSIPTIDLRSPLRLASKTSYQQKKKKKKGQNIRL